MKKIIGFFYPKNVSEIVEYLKKDTGYRKAFKDINPLVAHRGQIELELYKNIVKQIEDLLPYLKVIIKSIL